MDNMGNGMALVTKAHTQAMAEKNELALMAHLSPTSKQKMAKQIYQRKMAELRSPEMFATSDSVSSQIIEI